MPNVLTQDCTVLCGPSASAPPPLGSPPNTPPPPLHGGKVTPLVGSGAKLRVGNAPVLLQADVAGKPVVGCATPVPPAPTVPCTSVVAVATGPAQKLRVGNQPVLLDTLSGATNGNPVGPLALSGVQTKLRSV